MNDKELDELLDKIFSNVNSWLNFAEAKNAANIALVVAMLAAILSLNEMNALLYSICILFSFSGIVSLISFLPKLGKKQLKKKGKKEETNNLLFFEDIKRYSGKAYLKQISKLYFKKDEKDFTKYQLDISDEIVYNSNVTSNKYALFKAAAWLDVISFVFLGISFFMMYYKSF